MRTANWSYGGVEMVVTQGVEPMHVGALLRGLLLVVVAPLAIAGWALAAFWPISGFVWLGVTVAFWVFAMSTAADEAELA